MDAMQFFMLHHGRLHTMIADRFCQLTDDQMRCRPYPQLNSIAWLLWHMARSEDMGINGLIANRPLVFDEGGWARRLARLCHLWDVCARWPVELSEHGRHRTPGDG